MKILIIGPSWIGDMVMSQSLYRTLKWNYPYALIDVISPLWCFPLLSYMPEINEAIPIPVAHGKLGIRTRLQLAYSLREKYYDQAYVLPNSFKSALVPFFLGIPHRIGWLGEMRYGLLNDMRVLNKGDWPMMVERYVALAYEKSVIRNSKNLPHPLLRPQLKVLDDEKIKIYNKFGLSLERKIICFCFGSEFGLAKCWPNYHFADLARLLINDGYQIFLFGSEKDRKSGEEIYSTLDIKQRHWCYNLSGQTNLEQAIVLITACKAVISNDTGLMHVASALNRPVIALYGPSSPDFTPPLSNNARIIRMITGHYKVRKWNFKKNYHWSMINITPKMVLDELKDLLSKQ